MAKHTLKTGKQRKTQVHPAAEGVLFKHFHQRFIVFSDRAKFFKVLLRIESSYSNLGRKWLSAAPIMVSAITPIFLVMSLR